MTELAAPRRRPVRTAGAVLVLLLSLGCAETGGIDLSGWLGGLGGQELLTEGTVVAGLKEALEVGTSRATDTLSSRGGFGDDPLLRIPLPEELRTLGTTLRTVGLGEQVDRFEAQMNRAAEQAAGAALPVFTAAVKDMTLQDAFAILDGPEDAATRYFQDRTSDALRARFAPVVERSMEAVGVYAVYQDLVARYDAIPFTKPPAPDLERYITDRTLSGLFGRLAEEEAKIRQDPVARSTRLLERVFDPDAVRAAVPAGA